MRRKSFCTKQRRNILTRWESQSCPPSKLCERNMPGFWNRNGKPTLLISRPGLIWKSFIMSGRMWSICWIFPPGGNRRGNRRSHGNRFLPAFVFSAFQRNAQPSPQVMISGVWGHVTNKHLAEIPGTGFLLNTQSYGRLHCLPILFYISK